MKEFGFWQKWGMELSDLKFANAFAALGVIAAGTPESLNAGPTGAKPSRHQTEKMQKTPDEAALQTAVLDSISHSQKDQLFVPWRFPAHDQLVSIGEQQCLISSLNQKEIAQTWEATLAGTQPLKPRFHITWYPRIEAVRPWFRLLYETSPRIQAAFIELDAADAHLTMKWPLRLGYLPGNSDGESVKKICSRWPSNELAKPARIDRDTANCDVLLFTGSISQLSSKLIETPVPQKTNLFIVRGAFEEDLTVTSRRLATIAAEARASGFVFIRPSVGDETLQTAINRFVENLSNNQSMDLAITEAFTKFSLTDPVIFLTKDLAVFKLAHILKTIRRRLESLPKAARLQIGVDSFIGAGAQIDRELADVTIPKVAATKIKEYESFNFFADSPAAPDRSDARRRFLAFTAKMSEAIDHEENQVASETRAQRFLQEQVFIKKKGKFVQERRAFKKFTPTLIRVRIGPPDEKWESAVGAFPEEKLPKDTEKWNLTVVLTESNHLKEPLRGSFKLPKIGTSEDCEFCIQPGEYPIFEARITVLHRGRVLQTGVLRGRVVGDENEISKRGKISFADSDRVIVRSHIGDLENRRQFDAAFVLNHSVSDKPQLTGIAANHAWLMDISNCNKIVEDLNSELTQIALVRDDRGLSSEENVKKLVKLAQIGREIYGAVVLDQLERSDNESSFASLEYIQIVSTKPDALLPLEFIYSTVPPSTNATLCPDLAAVVKESNAETRIQAATSLINGKCREVDQGTMKCPYRSIAYVCPMAFWGVSKVIERHIAAPQLAREGYDFYLQSEESEATTNRSVLELSGAAVVAASSKIKASELEPVLSACKDQLGLPPKEAKDWDQWVYLVGTVKPHVLLALPHTEGSGVDASLEIGGKTILSEQITDDYVHAAGETTYPLVALIGCDTAGTALDYGSHVSWFRRAGAAVVISTIAKVFGEHASTISENLVKGLKQETDQHERIGEIIRSIKRQALIDGTLMALCVVAFGDADWRLSTEGALQEFKPAGERPIVSPG